MSDTTCLKRNCDSTLTLLSLPTDSVFEIMLFCTVSSLLNLILSCKDLYESFTHYRRLSLNQKRVLLLNSQTIDRKNSRLIELYNSRQYEFVVNESKKVLQKNITEFREVFYGGLCEVTKVILDHFLDNTFVVAGGYVLDVIKRDPKKKKKFGSSAHDIDVFVIGEDRDELDKVMKRKLNELDSVIKDGIAIMKNSSVLEVYSEKMEFPVQFIFRKVSSYCELLSFFDLDSCRFIYNGEKVVTVFEGLRALYFSLNICPKQYYNKRLYFRRSIKYDYKGFKTIYFDLHPLHHYFELQKNYKNLIPSEKQRVNYYNIRYDTKESKYLVDDGLYNTFCNIRYKELKEICMKGVDKYIKDHENDDFDDYEYELNNYQLPLSNRIDEMKQCLKKDKYVFVNSFKDLLTNDLSCYLKNEKYFESHLFNKYDIIRCYICGRYKFIKLDNIKIDMDSMYSDGLRKLIEKMKLTLLEDHKFCDQCKAMNENMKLIKKDLSNKIALVIGARIKIGFCTALTLLRMNCKVIVTTRFPNDAAKRYQKEKDYLKFKDNLEIYALNLKNYQQVIQFISMIKGKFRRIHFLILSAAQTIRRPLLYYQNLIKSEVSDICNQITDNRSMVVTQFFNNDILSKHNEFLTKFVDMNQMQMLSNINSVEQPLLYQRTQTIRCCFENLIDEDFTMDNAELFPHNDTGDYNDNQNDTRAKTSWNLKPDEINPFELIDTQMINHIAPSLIVQNFVDIMKVSVEDSSTSYIVNVTSIEGSFQIEKTGDHIHTDMSKSSLNMLTKSSAQFYAQFGIIMNSVDTGWITSSLDTWRPPPLCFEDAAARILHPIVTDSKLYGKLYKDYRVVDW